MILTGWKIQKRFRGFQGRRQKAAIVFAMIWSSTIALHLVAWGYWFVFGLTTLMSVHAVRLMLARPHGMPKAIAEDGFFPTVSMLVAAKERRNGDRATGRNVVQFGLPLRSLRSVGD